MTRTDRKKNYIAYFDLLRVLSMFGVLFMHLSSARLAKVNSTGWYLIAGLDSFFFTAVPIFLMISGALILSAPQAQDARYLLRHRLPKIIVPLFVWSAATLAIDHLAAFLHGNGFGFVGYLQKLASIPLHEAAPPYWFIYYLIPLYLLSPLLSSAAKNLTDKAWRYLGIVVMITAFYKTAAALFPDGIGRVEIFERLFLFSGCAAYFFFGYWLHHAQFRIRNGVLLGVLILDTALITWMTGVLSSGGTLDQTMQSYNLIFTGILSVSLFLLIKQNGDRIPNSVQRCIHWLSGHSFCVYLSHVPVIRLLPTVGIDISSFGGFLLSIPLTLGICLMISMIAGRIRPLCYVLTGTRYKKK